MDCPDVIADIMFAILKHGILSARSRGYSGDGRRAGLEASHIHNLASLLQNYSHSKLEYYWESQRPSYIKARLKLGHSETGFEDLWNQLRIADPTLKSDEEIAAEDAENRAAPTFD